MDIYSRTTNSLIYNDSLNSSAPNLALTTPSALADLSNQIIIYLDTHREQIPLLVIVYVLTIVWILYLILYHSRVQGIILSYLLRRFYFTDATQIKFGSFSISFISGAIMFRNLHYTTGSYFVFVKDGCLVFRYWSKMKTKPLIRLKIKLYHLDVQFFSPIRSSTFNDNQTDDLQRGSINGISNKADDTQSENTVKTNEEGLFVKRLRSLFPAIEIKVEHGKISAGHSSLPYGLLVRFSTMTSTLTSISPSRNVPQIDLMTLIYHLKYRNLRVQLYPIKLYKGELLEVPPSIPTSKIADSGIYQVFECLDGELEYEQDVPGKTIELNDQQILPDVAWEIRIKCHKDSKLSYGPWADRQREALWQYFFPTVFEDYPVTPEPTVGQTRIFKSVRVKLWLFCPTIVDLYFKKKQKLHQIHAELPNHGSYIEATFPFSTNPDGFDTYLSMDLKKPVIRTNLSFSPLLQAEHVDILVHIHYPRMWNSIQIWSVDIVTNRAQVYFVFEHKNLFQDLINDWASSNPPDIYSFAPYIYDINIKGTYLELLVPCTQGNWIDCCDSSENNYLSVCAKTFSLGYPIPFLEFCPKATPMNLIIDVNDVLVRLVIPETNRMYYILEGIDAHKKFYAPNGIQSQLGLSAEFEKRDGCFDCGEVSNVKILIEILLHSSPPYDANRTDLLYVQQVKSFGNRQTFHPNKLEYDLFNIEIDLGPVNLFLHGLFLKKLWWIKENLFGWDQMYHDIREPDLIREKKIIVHDDPLVDLIDESTAFDPRYFRPLMVTLRVALHNITAHLVHHTDSEPCPIAFCERLCFEMTTDLDETRLQVFFLPINVYVEDLIQRNKSDQHLSTGYLQLTGLVIRGHAMLSHEGLPPERETLEYAWQMEVILGKISAKITAIQAEKLVCFLKNFYLQIMEDEYLLVRSPFIDKTKWIEKLKYDVLRFSLDSVDLNLVEIGNAVQIQLAPVRLCMCNMHTALCNESLTFKLGSIQIRQLLRLYPGSWLEAGSISIPELRINAKFECHPPTPATITEQLEFLRRHDQHSQRLHFLYATKTSVQTPSTTLNIPSTTTTAMNLKRPSNVGLATNINLPSCACLGGSTSYYTLVQGEQFFKSTFRLCEQSTFGRSLFRPDTHVIHSHPIFAKKYLWNQYERRTNSDEHLDDEEIYYPFDFCTQPKPTDNDQDLDNNDNHFRHSVPTDLYSLSRTNSAQNIRPQTLINATEHKRSSSIIPLNNSIPSSLTSADVYLTPNEQLSQTNSSHSSLSHRYESSSISSLTMIHQRSSPSQLTRQTKDDLISNSSFSSSTDSLTALEEILQRQELRQSSTCLPQVSSTNDYKSLPQTTLPSSSWISLRNQMKMPIPKSTLLCTTYIRYLSHYRTSTWSNRASFPPPIQQDQIDSRPILDFNCVSQGFSCSFLTEIGSSSQSFTNSSTTTTNTRPRLSVASAISPTNASNIIATEKEICLRFIGALNILLTPLMLECLTTYIDKLETYQLHPISILDGLHIQAQTQSNPSLISTDLSATKISFQLSKINVCLLQAGLAEDNVQLTELRTPVDIVTMSLFALSCRQIQMETILSQRDQSNAGIFKIKSITGQFRRFENDFSSIENVNIHAIQSQRCRLQFRLPNDIQTHLPLGINRKNVGFVMNEFGLQRLCFKLINNAAKQQQQQQRNITSPIVIQTDETQPSRIPSKHKSKRKQSTEPLLSSPSASHPPITVTSSVVSIHSNSSSSSVFDGSIDHIWISFPEPPHHTHSTSKRPRTNTSNPMQHIPNPKKLFSYTRYDWNFLSTLSPTVLGWFCVINRIQNPVENFFHQREKHLDAVLAYFLIETTPISTLTQSHLYELFTPKTKYLLSHPVCQLVTELRKHFNRNTQIHIHLQDNLVPELNILKQGIRESCRGWAQTVKQQPTNKTLVQPPASSNTTSPINSVLPTTTTTTTAAAAGGVNDQEQSSANARTSSMVDRVQRLIGHEFVVAHPPRRMTVQNVRSNLNNHRETILEIDTEQVDSSANMERRRASGFLGDAMRRFEPQVNVNNMNGYKRLSINHDESAFDDVLNTSHRLSETNHSESTPYYTDVGPEFAGPVEQLYKILLEYAGVQLSVASSIEPLFKKLGQTVLATAQIKRFDVKILPNEPTNDFQINGNSHPTPTATTLVQFRLPHNRSSILTTTNELSLLSVTNLSIQSVCRQSLEHDQLHSANVQAGIRVQRVKQEVNLSFIRLVYQFYTVVGNALEYTGIDELTKPDATSIDLVTATTTTNEIPILPEHGIQNLVLKSLDPNMLHMNDELDSSSRQCWKKLRELVAIYGTLPEVKEVQQPVVPSTSNTRKQQRSGSQPPPNENHASSFRYQIRPIATSFSNETLLLSSFGWLIIDEILYTASLGGLKVDGSMKKVQGSVNLSQRLRALHPTTNYPNTKKYDGSLIVQIDSTSLSLKETLSTTNENLSHPNTPILNATANTSSSSSSAAATHQISVLDIIIGKSRALTSLQTRGISLTLSAVTNIGTIAMDVPLRPQEVHDLVNRAGRLITSYVQEFLPDDTQTTSTIPSTADEQLEQLNADLDNTIVEPNTPVPSEEITTKKRLTTRRKNSTKANLPLQPLDTRQSLSSNKQPIFEVHITAHCQGMTFSTTLLSTLKAQYKIGVVEGVANIGATTSRFTAIIHEHALHFLNNNSNDQRQPPTVSSDNHVRIDFPQIRCYGNYSIHQEQNTKTKGHLNLRTKIDLLKLTITADFLAQLVFVSKVIIHEINEILAKVSGFDKFYFRTNTNHKNPRSSSTSTAVIMRLASTDTEEEYDDDDDDEDEREKDQQPTPPTPFTYIIDISMKGFEVIGQTPSNTVVKFENGDKKAPIRVKLTNYDEKNPLLLYNKPLINALLYIKLSLGQLLHTGSFQDAAYFKTKLLLRNSFQSDDPDKEAYFIRLTKPSFYWQPGAIDKGILFWLNYKNTYEHWNEQRGAFTTPSTNDSTRLRSIVNVPTSPTTIKELNLMFHLHIVDLGIAIPLQQTDSPATKLSSDNQIHMSQPLNTTIDESSDFLVFTLDKTTISACSCGAIISSGSFEGFCFRFAENFQQTNKDWKPTRSLSSSNIILNACCVPSGQYLMHSRARTIAHSASPKWFLSVQWDMKGIDINVDSIIGKRFSQLIRTITSTQLIETNNQSTDEDSSSSNINLNNIQMGSTENLDDNEDDERIKRLEYEHLILGQKIETLKRSSASNDILKSELERYQWLENELLQTVKSEFHQKMKKQSNKGNRNRIDSPSHKHSLSQENGTSQRPIITDVDGSQIPTFRENTKTSRHIRFPSQEAAPIFDEHYSLTPTPNEITSAPAVDFELNVQIQIASGSCNLYTSRDLIFKQQQQQQPQASIGPIININKIDYQISQFFIPGIDVNAHYNSKHHNTVNSSLNKRASFYCRATIQSPTTQITIHPLLLDFLEQTLEHVNITREQTNIQQDDSQINGTQNGDSDHLNTMFLIEDQSSTTSFPIDVVVSLFIQPSILLFTCQPTHPMECELRLPTVDVVFSSKRAINDNTSEHILENSQAGLSFSLYMKDFKLNVYHPFSGESKVHLFEDIRSGQLQTRNALAVSVQSVSFNISRTRYTLIEPNGELLNHIQLSVIGQISKAQFEYDIRRFSEILTFPKIWYNRSLARRVFLGDENLPPTSTIHRPRTPTISKTIPTPTKSLRKEARVLLALQLKELQISMRMSNVMGKVEWTTTDVCSTGRLTLANDGHRTFFFSLGLEKSIFQAEQGIVGGLIRLKNLRTTGLLQQDLQDRGFLNESSHVFDILTDAIEIRLDYMGSPTLMGRICHILLRLKDDHHGIPNNELTPASTLIFLHLEWSQLHLMITRSTTPDIVKMINKLTEFVNAQIANSKNLLASVQYDFHDANKRTNNNNSNLDKKKTSNGQTKYDTNLIKRYIGMHGGELMLQGHNLTLVVFHGLNFKSRQWALFSLNEPQINFVTDRGETGDINQKLFFYLGHQGQTMPASIKSRTNMASISKVIRNSNEAPSHLTINEWFNYASSTISAVGLRDFPSMDDVPHSIPTGKLRSKQFEQNAESIFILPALELRFQTRQLDGQVHCSFETEFYEHIMFSFNAEHFYFLHDLITSYIKEKEKATANEKQPRQRLAKTSPENSTLTTFDEARSDDIRQYHCPDAKWKLQPTIKLLTAYGNEVEPFGADYILQKLGFRHARLTIPKWLQRGIMDPCEQSMSIVQLFLIFLLPERYKEICMKHKTF